MLLHELCEGGTRFTHLSFKGDVASKVVNILNAKFKKHQSSNRAFLINKNHVEINVPAGMEVDIVDAALDEYDGVYGKEWFKKEEMNEAATKSLAILANEFEKIYDAGDGGASWTEDDLQEKIWTFLEKNGINQHKDERIFNAAYDKIYNQLGASNDWD